MDNASVISGLVRGKTVIIGEMTGGETRIDDGTTTAVDATTIAVDGMMIERGGTTIDVDATMTDVLTLSRGKYGYGSIPRPIHTIFRGMNIHLPAILMFTRAIGF